MLQNKLIVIIGPTCSSKNKLANLLCDNFDCEIINADAFQVYKELNIGINKPNHETLKKYKHHLISFINYKDEWDIFLFQKEFDKIYKDIVSRNKIPILCGGSHMYIDAIVSGYNFIPYSLNDDINNLDKNYSNEKLYEYIKNHDLEYSNKISINNRRRLLRSVAIMQKENKTMTELNSLNKSKYNSLVIMCNKNREQLYELINKRTLEMLSNDKWVNEVKELISKDKDIINSQCFKALGYKEVYESIVNNTEVDINSIQQKTRHLAKRQLTWCNNKFNNKIIYDWNNPIDIIKIIKEFYYENN